MNKAILIGRLTRDPELKHTQNGNPVANFTLAVDRGYGKEKEADFINIVVWNKAAEAVDRYLGKGSLVAVEGSIRVRSYEAKDGGRRYVTEVVANNVKFLEKKGQAEASDQEHYDNRPDPFEEEEAPF